MAKTDEKVQAAVEQELKRNPGATLDDLIAKATEASPEHMKSLDRRQFNARYPLQIKRKLQIMGGGGGGPSKAAPSGEATSKAAPKAPAAPPAQKPAAQKPAAQKPTAKAKAPARANQAKAGAGGGAKSTVKAAAPAPKPAPQASAAPAAAAPSNGDRDAIRGVFMGFAQDLVGAADDPKRLVQVLAGIDRYVEKVSKAQG